MNKKGFTLVEIIVSVALLALIGVIVGISLNSTIKKQQISSYEEYVEKVKSSALLYINNTPSIINELNANYSYKILEARDVISNGYLNENLIDPSTKEKINRNDKIKAYYDENYELMIDYPYENNNGENYLYTRNYNAIYNSDERNLCYIGINTNELQIINSLTGLKVGVNLISYNENETKANIIAYMEDGRLCTDEIINTSKIGSYKIRYTYTIDGTPVSSSNNKKTAERTITIKPSKPKINSFDIKSQSDNSVYDASLNLSVTDVKDVTLKYCIVGVNSDDKIEISSLFSKCQNTPKIINNVTQLNNYWIDLDNGAYDSTSKKVKYVVNNKTFNIQSEMNELSTYNEIKFYIFVKNNYEEYSSTFTENNYILKVRIRFNANEGKFKNNSSINNIFIKKGSVFSEALSSNSYEEPTRNDYIFEGWNINGTTYTKDTSTKLTTDVEAIANWYKLCVDIDRTETNCSANCGGGKKTITIKDKKYSSVVCNTSTESCNTHACTTTTTAGKNPVCISPVSKQLKNECDCYAGDGVPMLIWYDNTYCYCCKKGYA